MPCVCLANTFARWKSLKAQKLSLSKSEPAQIQPKQTRVSGVFVDGTAVKVSHTRKAFSAAPSLGNNVVMQAISNSAQPTDKTANTTPAQALSTATDNLTIAQSTSGVAQPIYTRKPSRKLKGLRQYRNSKNMKKPDGPNVSFGRPAVRMTRADLINAESRLGSTIFGPIPSGHRREFFHDRNNVWIWHEDWCDGQNNPHQMTVRYEVRTSGVYKKVSSGKYLKLEDEELENFRKATHAYLDVIKKNLYNQLKFAKTMI